MGLLKQFSLGGGVLGKGDVHCSWNAQSNLIAVCGAKGRVAVLRPDGTAEHQFSQNRLVDLQWNLTDDILAMITDASSSVAMYNHNTRDTTVFDAGVKYLNLIRWSFTGNELFIGTQKGSYVVYQRNTQRRVPIVGTHSQSILDAAWSRVENRLVMMAADNLLSVSDAEGNVLSTTSLDGTPESMCLLETLRPSVPSQFGHCIVVVNLQTQLHLVNLQTGKSHTVLRSESDSSENGRVTSLAACSSSSCVVGYSSGRVGLMELSESDPKSGAGARGDATLRLVSCMDAFSRSVVRVAYGDGSGLSVAMDSRSIRLFNRAGDTLVNLKDTTPSLEGELGELKGAQWSPDGQKLLLYSEGGDLVSFMMQVVNVGTSFGSLVYYCISSRLVGIKNMRAGGGGGKVLCTVPIDMDAKFMAAGLATLAVGANNMVMYYEYYIPNTMVMPPHIAASAAVTAASANTAISSSPGANRTKSSSISGGDNNRHNMDTDSSDYTTTTNYNNNSNISSDNNTIRTTDAVKSINPQEPQSMRVRTVQYPSKVVAVRVCSHSAAVLCDGRIKVHPISNSANPAILSGTFPMTKNAQNTTVAPPTSPYSARSDSKESNRAAAAAAAATEGDSDAESENSDAAVIDLALTESLLLFATSRKITVVALGQMSIVSEYTARTPIRRVFANAHCSRAAFMDLSGSLFVLNPVTNIATQAEGYEKDHDRLCWDNADSTVFVTYNNQSAVTFVCAAHSRHGPTCESVLVRNSTSDSLYTTLLADWTPLALHRGVLVGLTSMGLLESVLLSSHREITSRTANAEAFYNNFSLNRLRWASQNITSQAEAQDLAVKALHMLDLELAIRVYRQLAQPGLVLCLEKIKHIHEKNLLIGHVSMIMGYFKDAHTFYLRSSQPVQALHMRHDLMQWEPALALAADLAPEQLPDIATEYAQQLEYRGDYFRAREKYRQGVHAQLPQGHMCTELLVAQRAAEAHNQLCAEGIARCDLRTGDLEAGLAYTSQSTNRAFVLECAVLCEELKAYEAAARLYEQGQQVERAVQLYLDKARNLKAAGRLLPGLSSRNLWGMYAAAKEAEGAYREAADAYTQAQDYDNVVRLSVTVLNDWHAAHVLVRRTKSTDAALLVARVCEQRGEYDTAVEFLVLAHSTTRAFELAKEHGCMNRFENTLLSQAGVSSSSSSSSINNSSDSNTTNSMTDGVAPASMQSEFARVADYHDAAHRVGQAAMFYHMAGNFPLAVQKYLESGEPEDIDSAIRVVGKSRSDSLTNKLIDYLMGEVDHEPKNPAYIFKLYMALGSFEKAAKTCVIIATKEQEMGNYTTAHRTLVEACRILREKHLRIPNDLKRTLMLLHSYLIVKDVIKLMQDEATGCRMLLRVSRNIQKFPMHIAAIVSATVVQCLKSGFKKSAFDLAVFLVQNEKYRLELSATNRKRIEATVRHRGKEEEMVDPVEKTTACPFCDSPVPETELDCGACKNTLPFCVVTGKHVTRDNFTTTPCCDFPALYSALIVRLDSTVVCPMCGGTIDRNKLIRQNDVDVKALQ